MPANFTCAMAARRSARVSQGVTAFKDAKNGRFVTAKTAKRRPATTYATQLKPPRRKK